MVTQIVIVELTSDGNFFKRKKIRPLTNGALPNLVWAPIIHYQGFMCAHGHDTNVSMLLINSCTINLHMSIR
jgi:hypothetical protein